MIDAGAHFTEGVSADDPILLKIIIAGMMILIIQSGSKFSLVRKAELSCVFLRIIISLF